MSYNISDKILVHKDEILEDIIQAIRIRSVREEAKPGMPFGEGPAEALDFCLNLARNFGLKVKNIGNYAGHIEYGEGETLVGVLAHVDVVPAGEGWHYPPFGGEVQDGRIYGRGTMDDKGSAIAAIYCLKVLKDLKIVPKARIRVILGAGEECGMEDMDYYFKHEEMPDFAFSPDGEYPVCNCEKGIMHIQFQSEEKCGKILRLEAGNAANMVPVNAQAVVSGRKELADQLGRAAEKLETENDRIHFAILPQEDGTVKINCGGMAAHASTPEEGANSAAYLIHLLHDGLGEEAGSFVKFLDEKIGLDYLGEGFKVSCSDQESGDLTLNLGIVNCSGEKSEAVIDIRYPVTKNGGELSGLILSQAKACGVEAKLENDTVPLRIDPSSELIQKLCNAYRTVTKEEPRLYSTGGGSYARALNNNGVAFGAGIKPLAYYHIHAADEFLEIEDFMQHCRICLQAIYELACC